MSVSFLSLQLPTVTLLELKLLTEFDLDAIVELDQLCFGGLWTHSGYQRELISPNSVMLGVFAAGEIQSDSATPHSLLGIGCLWAILDEAHITVLAVHPHYRRRGLGQLLLVGLLLSACDRGLERATLEVRASNSKAISLYQKFGFKTAGRRKGYYRDTGEDALILWLGDLQDPKFQETLANWQRQARPSAGF